MRNCDFHGVLPSIPGVHNYVTDFRLLLCAEKDSNLRRKFPVNLQSTLIGRSSTDACAGLSPAGVLILAHPKSPVKGYRLPGFPGIQTVRSQIPLALSDNLTGGWPVRHYVSSISLCVPLLMRRGYAKFLLQLPKESLVPSGDRQRSRHSAPPFLRR